MNKHKRQLLIAFTALICLTSSLSVSTAILVYPGGGAGLPTEPKIKKHRNNRRSPAPPKTVDAEREGEDPEEDETSRKRFIGMLKSLKILLDSESSLELLNQKRKYSKIVKLAGSKSKFNRGFWNWFGGGEDDEHEKKDDDHEDDHHDDHEEHHDDHEEHHDDHEEHHDDHEEHHDDHEDDHEEHHDDHEDDHHDDHEEHHDDHEEHHDDHKEHHDDHEEQHDDHEDENHDDHEGKNQQKKSPEFSDLEDEVCDLLDKILTTDLEKFEKLGDGGQDYLRELEIELFEDFNFKEHSPTLNLRGILQKLFKKFSVSFRSKRAAEDYLSCVGRRVMDFYDKIKDDFSEDGKKQHKTKDPYDLNYHGSCSGMLD